MFYLKKYVLSTSLVFLLCSCGYTDNQRAHNLSSFAHTYGLVRWFHPSEEAAKIDWNKFALYGVKEVADCRSQKELQQKLEELFLPIAPTISFSKEQKSSNDDDYILSLPVNKDDLLPVFWQHSGVDLGIWSNNYVSKRANRPLATQNISKLALHGYFPADTYKGHKIRMSAKIKIEPGSPNPALHIILIKPSRNDFPNAAEFYTKLCANDSSAVLPNNKDWRIYEREITIDDSLGDLYWGLYPERAGAFLVERISLYDVTTNRTISDFLFGTSRKERSDGQINEDLIRTNPISFDYSEYDNYLRISSKNQIFEDTPEADSVISRNIGSQLYVNIPLVLYGDSTCTYPKGNQYALEELNSKISAFEKEGNKASNTYKEYADIVVTWNVIKYFSPYLDELSLQWDDELATALGMLKNDKGDDYNRMPLELMMAKLEDAHVVVTTQSDYSQQSRYSLPFSVKKVEDKIVVAQSNNPLIKVGDIVQKINNEDIHKKYADCEKRVSGSLFHKSNIARQTFPFEYRNDISLKIDIIRNEEKFILEMNTVPGYIMYNILYGRASREDNVRQISENITYINVSGLDFDRITEIFEKRSSNQTIIFDIREGSPSFLLRYIIPLLAIANEPLPGRREILITPQVIYPKTPIVPDTLSSVAPKTPSLKNIFLINGNNISNMEETLDYIRYAGLGYFIGSNTAGCSGMINIIPLPSGGQVVFTGAKSLSLMGAEHYYYRVGIKPDYFIEETIDDIQRGRDVILEKAIEIVINGNARI